MGVMSVNLDKERWDGTSREILEDWFILFKKVMNDFRILATPIIWMKETVFWVFPREPE